MAELCGNIFNIQHFSTHDGPGIRTTVFLQGCPLRCFWCQNPESQSAKPVLLANAALCTGCGRCAAVCPRGAIAVEDGKARTARTLCTVCGVCAEACLNRARRVSGRSVTVGEVVREVLRDQAFYQKSGGGVTLSGGDPVFQPAFSAALLTACRERWLHTALETSGFTDRETFARLLELTELLMLDIKCVDGEKHRRATGVSNAPILANAHLAAASGKALFRTPLIPGFNDSPADVLALRRFVEDELKLSAAEHLELLRYNRMGEAKYDHLDKAGARPALAPQDDETFEELKELLR